MKQVGKDTWVVLAIVTVVLVTTTTLVYLPQSRQLKRIRTQIVTQERALKADSELASIVPALLQQIEAMSRRYSDFDRLLPKRQELGGFLREISNHLAEEQLSGQLIEPGSPTSQELFHTLPIIMRFKGSYLSVASFLRRLDGMERLTRVQKLQVTRGATSNSPDELEVELQINIYFTES